MYVALQRNEAGAANVGGYLAPLFEGTGAVAAAVQDQSGGGDLR